MLLKASDNASSRMHQPTIIHYVVNTLLLNTTQQHRLISAYLIRHSIANRFLPYERPTHSGPSLSIFSVII
jgi:hypothetical protein